MPPRKSDEPTTTQEEPTAPQPMDANGRRLDRWGLPLLGPDRVDALAGRTDPEVDATGWADATTDAPDAASAPQE